MYDILPIIFSNCTQLTLIAFKRVNHFCYTHASKLTRDINNFSMFEIGLRGETDLIDMFSYNPNVIDGIYKSKNIELAFRYADTKNIVMNIKAATASGSVELVKYLLCKYEENKGYPYKIKNYNFNCKSLTLEMFKYLNESFDIKLSVYEIVSSGNAELAKYIMNSYDDYTDFCCVERINRVDDISFFMSFYKIIDYDTLDDLLSYTNNRDVLDKLYELYKDIIDEFGIKTRDSLVCKVIPPEVYKKIYKSDDEPHFGRVLYATESKNIILADYFYNNMILTGGNLSNYISMLCKIGDYNKVVEVCEKHDEYHPPHHKYKYEIRMYLDMRMLKRYGIKDYYKLVKRRTKSIYNIHLLKKLEAML